MGWLYATIYLTIVLSSHHNNMSQLCIQESQVGLNHHNDVITGSMASQITSLAIVYSAVYSGADQRKHQISTSMAFVWGIHRGPVNSPHKWPVTRKMFPFDDVIMILLVILRMWKCENSNAETANRKSTPGLNLNGLCEPFSHVLQRRPGANETTLKDMGKIDRYLTKATRFTDAGTPSGLSRTSREVMILYVMIFIRPSLDGIMVWRCPSVRPSVRPSDC